MSNKNQKLSYCILISSLISASFTSRAELLIIPTLDLSGIYTDNVTLAEQGSEESDFITRLAPGVIVRHRGNRTQFNLDYRFEYLIYAEDSDRNTSFNQLQTNLTTELVRDYFFLDADASIDQSVIDPTEPVSSNIQVTTNRTNVNTAGISPYLFFPLFSLARSELRYRFQYLDYDDENLSDTTTERVYFRTRNLRRSNRFSWNFVYDRVRLEYKETNDGLITEDTSLQLRYRTTPNFAIIVTGGYDVIDFFNSPFEDESYSRGDAGFAWDVSSRTSMELRAGDRYDEPTYFGRFSSSTRFSTTNLVYSEELTTAAQQQLSQGGVQRQDDTRATPDDDTAPTPDDRQDPLATSLGNAAINNPEPFVEKRLELNYSYTKRENRFLLNGYKLERNFVISNNLEKEHGGYARIDWQMMPRTILSLFSNYSSQTNETTASTVISRDIGLRATRRISSRSTGYLEYRYFESEQNPAMVTRDENIVEATLQLTF